MSDDMEQLRNGEWCWHYAGASLRDEPSPALAVRDIRPGPEGIAALIIFTPNGIMTEPAVHRYDSPRLNNINISRHGCWSCKRRDLKDT